MRISDAALGALGLLFLAGCAGGSGVSRNAPHSIALPDGLVVAGAEGWCVDTSTSRAGADTSVVVLGSCASITGDAFRPRPDVPGVVMVSVEAQAGVVPDGKTLQKFFTSEAGRSVLARNGSADSVRVIESRIRDGNVYLRSSDRSMGGAAAPETWRAIFGLAGRFVTISLYAPANEPIESEAGFDALVEQVNRLRAANRV